MIYYVETKKKRRSVFSKIVTDDSGLISYQRDVKIPMYKVEDNGFLYLILYDDNMVPINDAYGYLNTKMSNSPLTSRLIAATALRLLYCFLSLSTYKINELGDQETTELIHFLRGDNANPEEYGSLPQRTNGTVNGYLGVYRSYLKYLKVEDSALFNCRKAIIPGASDGSPSEPTMLYENNLKVSSHRYESVPKYISVDEFNALYRVMTEAGDEQSRIIIHLMFGYGLRIGEVLGITSEDIVEGREKGQLIPIIYLRNRMSDARFQYCKGLPHVTNKRQYNSKDYHSATQKIVISHEFYKQMVDFLNQNHDMMMGKYPENYAKGFADIVSSGKEKPESNHYVFLNRYGRILSDQTWNNNLKKYFEEVGIPIDTNVRENNLSHKFRHGFAMRLVYNTEHPVGILELQKLMRHKSPLSTMIYFNPDLLDEYNAKEKYQQELYNLVPDLKEDL